MKEHGLLMSAPMMLAYLAGKKTVTRRTGDRYAKWLVGDGLWFRETFKVVDFSDRRGDRDAVFYRADQSGRCFRTYTHEPMAVMPKPDSLDPLFFEAGWKPSLFMPRWASRATPKITCICRERVQDITEAEAVLEGFERREHFIQLWCQLNGEKSWLDNVRVTRIQFTRCEQ